MRNIISQIPFFGGMAMARVRDHWGAMVELVPNLLFSTVPIWLGAILMLADESNEKNWFQLLMANLQNGELYIYSTALLGPLYYFIFTEYAGVNKFPNGRSLIIGSSLISLCAVAYFSALKTGKMFGFLGKIDKEFVFAFSWKLYLGAVLIAYLAYVYKKMLEGSTADIEQRQTGSFLDEYNRSQE